MIARTATAAAVTPSTRLAVGLAALLGGIFFVWVAGFANAAAMHDTAHDVRHGYGFPCH